MQSLFEKVNQIYLSLKSYQDTKTAKYFWVSMLLHYQNRIFISGHSKFDMDWNLFLQNCFYIKLLIIMFIRMCDAQYWKISNICNTWKINEKLKILMTCDDLPFINTTKKALKPSKKCFNSQDGWEKTSYLRISAEVYQQKHEIYVAAKKVYWKNNRLFQTLATYHHWKRYFFRT